MKAIFLLDSTPYAQIYGGDLPAQIARRCELVPPLLTPATWRQASAEAREAELIFSGWSMPQVDAEFLAAFPNLKAIFYGAGTIRFFATDAMWDRGIRVTAAASENSANVAEFTLAQILLSLKQAFPRALAFREDTVAAYSGIPAGNFGSTVGLISLGMIGRRVAELLQTFKHKVIAFDPFATPARAAALGVELVSLEDLFSRADVVSCHAPLLDSTIGMLREEHFARLKPGATFINTSRGAIVDEPGLCRTLAARPDVFALLDVTWPEPPALDSPLRKLPNVLYTPHLAGCMGRECERMGALMLAEFDRYAAGKPLLAEITRERAALLA